MKCIKGGEVGSNEIISSAKALIEEPKIILATLKIYSPPFDSVMASGLPLRMHIIA